MLIFAFLLGVCAQQVFYLDSLSGSSVTDCGGIDTPCKTFEGAYSQSTPSVGNVVFVTKVYLEVGTPINLTNIHLEGVSTSSSERARLRINAPDGPISVPGYFSNQNTSSLKCFECFIPSTLNGADKFLIYSNGVSLLLQQLSVIQDTLSLNIDYSLLRVDSGLFFMISVFIWLICFVFRFYGLVSISFGWDYYVCFTLYSI
jgi:hypothetical protein